MKKKSTSKSAFFNLRVLIAAVFCLVGGWFLYAIQIDPANPTQLGDYPKFAVWNSGGSPAQNAYFFTVNLFTNPTTFVGVRAFALDRASMLAGGPTHAIAFSLSAADDAASPPDILRLRPLTSSSEKPIRL